MDGILAVLSMVVVLVVVLFGAYFTTRWLATNMGGGFQAQGEKLTVVSRLSLGREQQLLVVKIANRHVVLGYTPSQVNFITELTAEESLAFFSEESVAEENNIPNFAQILLGLREKKEKEDTKD